MSTCEQIEADVAIVGGGGAGLAAAAEARRLCSRVILVEKAATLGGTTALSVGSIMAAGTRLQKAAGIQDSAGEHAEDLAAICTRLGLSDNATLRQLFADHASEAVDFLETIGVVFTTPMAQPPHRKPRLHQVIPGSRSYIFHLERHCRKLGVEIRLGVQAASLLVDRGKVVGIEARHRNGSLMRVIARCGVVLASGDIAGNSKLLDAFAAKGLKHVEVLNPVCTGDGHLMAERIGARIVPRRDFGAAGLAHIRFIPPTKRSWVHRLPLHTGIARLIKVSMAILPEALVRPFVLRFLTTTLGPDRGMFERGAVLVNKHGERFAEELGGPNINDITRHSRTNGTSTGETSAPSIRLAEQPDRLGYLVFDDQFAKRFSAWPYFISTAPGVAYAYVDDYRRARPDIFHSAPTLEDLAAKLGFDTAKFRSAVGTLNDARADVARHIAQPPFYALGPVKSWILVTPVGLAVNDRLQVLDGNNTPIDGLFAAGGAGQGGFSITGHGHGLGWAFTSGLLAGRHASMKDIER